jgi:hypothetical protein
MAQKALSTRPVAQIPGHGRCLLSSGHHHVDAPAVAFAADTIGVPTPGALSNHAVACAPWSTMVTRRMLLLLTVMDDPE